MANTVQEGIVSLRMEDWTSIIEGEAFDVIYIDFSKVFDSVGHERLLQKLEYMSIVWNLLNWIRKFLSGRLQCVNVEGIRSNLKEVINGVPRGFVKDPLSSVTFITEVKFNMCKLFDDYCKLNGSANTGKTCSRRGAVAKSVEHNFDNCVRQHLNGVVSVNT